MGRPHARVLAVRRHRRQKRRSMVGRGVHRYGATPESENRRIRRILVAAFYEYSQGVRRRFHHAGRLLGGKQPWRLDCEAAAAELSAPTGRRPAEHPKFERPEAPPSQMTRYQFLTDAYETEILKTVS